MRRQFRHRQDWWADSRGEFWANPSRGAEAWTGFGRKMLFGAFIFLAVVALVISGLVWLIATLLDSVGFLGLVAIVALTPIVLAVVAGSIFAAARQTWRPVRDIITAAGSLADGDYSARVRPARSR